LDSDIVLPENIRALIYVLVLAAPAFYFSRKLTASVVSAREFAIWRNSWFIATVAAFLSGRYFVVYAAIVVMLCLYGHAVRAASVALFVILLYAVPIVDIPIGGLGIFNALFDINNARLLVIFLLVPILFARNGSKIRGAGTFATPDRLVVGYVVLLTALQFRQSDITHVVRVAAVNTIDVLIPYFAFSRTVTSLADLRKISAALVVGALPLALIGVVETVKVWHLYASIAQDWGGDRLMGYLARQGLLRASASASGPITLGFVLMVGLGGLLAFQETIRPRSVAIITFVLLAAALVSTLSRGPWVGAGVLILAFLVFGPNAAANLGKLAAIGAAVPLLLIQTPLGERIVDLLPFVGSVDADTIGYRQRLFENSTKVIERNLWLGSADYLSTPEMEAMRQGEGIIDIVNTYLRVTLASGVVGLALFLSFFVVILAGLRLAATRNAGLGSCIRAFAATLIAILVTIATVSSYDYTPYIYWSFAGLCVALIRVAFLKRAAIPYGVVPPRIVS
jgi:hypothetical protein